MEIYTRGDGVGKIPQHEDACIFLREPAGVGSDAAKLQKSTYGRVGRCAWRWFPARASGTGFSRFVKQDNIYTRERFVRENAGICRSVHFLATATGTGFSSIFDNKKLMEIHAREAGLAGESRFQFGICATHFRNLPNPVSESA